MLQIQTEGKITSFSEAMVDEIVVIVVAFCGQFHQGSTNSFYACRSQKRMKYRQAVSLFLHFQDLRA